VIIDDDPLYFMAQSKPTKFESFFYISTSLMGVNYYRKYFLRSKPRITNKLINKLDLINVQKLIIKTIQNKNWHLYYLLMETIIFVPALMTCSFWFLDKYIYYGILGVGGCVLNHIYAILAHTCNITELNKQLESLTCKQNEPISKESDKPITKEPDKPTPKEPDESASWRHSKSIQNDAISASPSPEILDNPQIIRWTLEIGTNKLEQKIVIIKNCYYTELSFVFDDETTGMRCLTELNTLIPSQIYQLANDPNSAKQIQQIFMNECSIMDPKKLDNIMDQKRLDNNIMLLYLAYTKTINQEN